MPPRDPKTVNRRRKSKLNLDMPEPELAKMLHQYCDLRRRGFTQQAIQTKAGWTRSHQKLLLEEAQRRAMPGSQGSQEQAVTEWLLEMFDAGVELRAIQRASAYTGQQTEKKLQTALDAASGPAPTGLIIRNLDGTPARVSWLDANRNLMHTGRLTAPSRPITPQNSPYGSAQKSCTSYWATQTIRPVIAPTLCCSWHKLACTHLTTKRASRSTLTWKQPKWTRTQSASSSWNSIPTRT